MNVPVGWPVAALTTVTLPVVKPTAREEESGDQAKEVATSAKRQSSAFGARFPSAPNLNNFTERDVVDNVARRALEGEREEIIEEDVCKGERVEAM